ncbi:2OG-Fe(II) oxygenase [Shewanella sp. Isolate13]|uniref:2OG-Fe(II) oxygenase n=1 Tax=Shewanella sp. Isolate13 TaxID=2908531 RepID=UPI001EFD9A69|nr:2OG-Fe(II) oxygenase [Shewanella sp. Isolate13]MCG9731967.1 2OG-Fe(II) oxygenase [Shewanella sp. Isolate13]
MVPQLSEAVMDTIADALVETGYIVLPDTLPPSVCEQLLLSSKNATWDDFRPAAIGRGGEQQLVESIRSDQIRWLSEQRPADKLYLDLMTQLREGMNKRLFMGLFDFESHYAIYEPGAFYQKHSDVLQGSRNRILTSVLFLNHDWKAEHGGELIVYDENDNKLETISPNFGKWVVFLSERFPHEVLRTEVNRYSIAGWFRVSNANHGF